MKSKNKSATFRLVLVIRKENVAALTMKSKNKSAALSATFSDKKRKCGKL